MEVQVLSSAPYIQAQRVVHAQDLLPIAGQGYTSFVSALFSTTPGLYPMLVAVIVIELLSLLVMWLIVLMFRRARLRQKEFFLQLYGIELDADPATYPAPVQKLVSHIEFPLLLWLYVLCTIGITVVTFVIFYLQPHLL